MFGLGIGASKKELDRNQDALDDYDMFIRDSYCQSCADQATRVQDQIDEWINDKDKCMEACWAKSETLHATDDAGNTLCENHCTMTDMKKALNDDDRHVTDRCSDLGYSVGAAVLKSAYNQLTYAPLWHLITFDGDALYDDAVAVSRVYHDILFDHHHG